MTRWTWAAASCRGTSHIRSSTRRQDAYKCAVDIANGDTFIAVVSDGAGSATMGGQSASLICRSMLTHVREHLVLNEILPSDEIVWDWINIVRERISRAATNRDLDCRDFAATLIFAISSGHETLVVHVGDGSAVIKCAESCEWIAVSWPEQGEYASTTYFVTDNPRPKVRFTRHHGLISSLVLFTDGLERLALNLGLNQAHQPFFQGITKAVFLSNVSGRDLALSRKLGEYLDSESVNERTDDDKTLVLAVRQ